MLDGALECQGLRRNEGRSCDCCGQRHARSGQPGIAADGRGRPDGDGVAGGADVILLDEPTAGMNRNEADRAVSLIRQLTEYRDFIQSKTQEKEA